jgi:NAD(P)H-hydrate repair Nnr-like enzyme with NAD(P)H-hydrate dehydratase domain
MATGGMGDVLTGVCGALLGQRLSPNDAARLGAWLCGRAAELANFNGKASEESLLPRDVLDHLGAAFRDLRERT